MNDVAAPRRASYGLSVLVAVGWYLTAVAAVLVGWSGVPEAPRTDDCNAVFSCLSPMEELGLLAIFAGGPVLVGLLVGTLGVGWLLARVVPSPILAGTLAALSSLVFVAVVGALWRGVG